LKRKWSVNEIEVQIVDPEPRQTGIESRLDALGPMIGVPQLGSNEDVCPRNPSSGHASLQRLAHLALVPVSFRAIEVSKSGFQRVSGSADRRGCIGYQSAEPEHRYLAGSVSERNSRSPKIGSFDQWTPS
jgi:hypothetical protein